MNCWSLEKVSIFVKYITIFTIIRVFNGLLVQSIQLPEIAGNCEQQRQHIAPAYQNLRDDNIRDTLLGHGRNSHKYRPCLVVFRV